MIRLRRVLAEEPQGLLAENDSIMFVVDSGATSMTTHDKDDFKPGTL